MDCKLAATLPSALHELIADGYVGDVLAVNMTMFTGGVLERPASRLWDRDRTKGVSALTVRGIHTMDSLCLLRRRIRRSLGEGHDAGKAVASRGERREVDVDTPDNVTVNGVLEGGALLSVHVATVPHNGSAWRLEIYGRDGTIRAVSKGSPQRDLNQLTGSKGSAPLAPLSIPGHFTEMPADTPEGPPRNVGHLYLRIAKAIRNATPVEPDFDLAVKRHRLIDAIQQASDEGRTIKLI